MGAHWRPWSLLARSWQPVPSSGARPAPTSGCPRRAARPRGGRALPRVVAPPAVLPAGAVVWRPADDDLELLVVHRPRHGDWSLPKGKLDPGEQVPGAAGREGPGGGAA